MLVGITGGIGSGKSTVSRRLLQLGYPVYDTDTHAKRLMQESPAVRQHLIAAFGSEAYTESGLNRHYLALRIFQDPEARALLNSIVHPAVREDLLCWCRAQRRTCFCESAILFESGFNQLCDRTVLVTAPMELRFARVILRDHTSAEALQQRINAQMSDEQKARLVDFVVNNDGTQLVSTLVDNLLQQLSHQRK